MGASIALVALGAVAQRVATPVAPTAMIRTFQGVAMAPHAPDNALGPLKVDQLRSPPRFCSLRDFQRSAWAALACRQMAAAAPTFSDSSPPG